MTVTRRLAPLVAIVLLAACGGTPSPSGSAAPATATPAATQSEAASASATATPDACNAANLATKKPDNAALKMRFAHSPAV